MHLSILLMMSRSLTIFILFTFLNLQTFASPTIRPSVALQRRTDPVFPASPASCPICQQGYPNIQGCAEACPVLANITMVIFNPGAFIDVIRCACTDTFQSVFPQCVDCFIQTNQTDVLGTSNLPSLVGDIRNICGLESALLGNVSGVDASLTSGAPVPTTAASLIPDAPAPTTAASLTLDAPVPATSAFVTPDAPVPTTSASAGVVIRSNDLFLKAALLTAAVCLFIGHLGF